MSLDWKLDGLDWVAGPYRCRLSLAPKGARPGTRHRWQPLCDGVPIGLPMCILECRKAIWAHARSAQPA